MIRTASTMPLQRVVLRVLDDWILTPERAALHLPTATAVIADPHLGYDQARRGSGEAVPLVSLQELFKPLETLFAHHEIRSLVVAGDLVEEGKHPGAALFLIDWLASRNVRLAGVVPGNHDEDLPKDGPFPVFTKGLKLGNWHVVHGDARLPRGLVIHGHVHPCLRWNSRLSGPCFLVKEDRIILPAFSQDASGLNVLGKKKWRDYRCHVIAGDKVLDFGLIKNLKFSRAHSSISF